MAFLGFSRSFFLAFFSLFLGHVPMPFNNQPGFDFLFLALKSLLSAFGNPFSAVPFPPFTFRFLVYCWVFIFHFWIDCSFSYNNLPDKEWWAWVVPSLVPFPFLAFHGSFLPFYTLFGLFPCWFSSQVLSSQFLVFPFGNFFPLSTYNNHPVPST